MDETPVVAAIKPLMLCPHCHIEMCLFGIEKESADREVFTFECPTCRHLEVRGVATP